jgi:hypothetical protein
MTKEQLKVGIRIKYENLIGTVIKIEETIFSTRWDSYQRKGQPPRISHIIYSLLARCEPYTPDDLS